MKLSGHSYDNDVFDSLLNGLSNDIVLNKKASKDNSQPISGMNVFSSTTEDDLNSIHEEELHFIASELQYAADNAKVALNKLDLVKFAKQVVTEKLKGKKLERAARKYCSEIDRAIAAPQGVTRRAESLVDQASSVVPAGYNPEYGPNNTNTGGYLGQSKNPNTIWDQDALQTFAKKTVNYMEMTGDEKIAHSQNIHKEYRQAMKDDEWQEKQDALSHPDMIHNKVASVHTGKEQGTHQALPENAMSIFSDNRDFENIPEKRAGEMLKSAAEDRAMKKSASKDEWNQVKPTQKVNNSLPGFFAGNTQPSGQVSSSTQRDAIDYIFESLLK